MSKGVITKKWVYDLIGFEDDIVRLMVKGSVIYEALENGVSSYPH